MCGLTCPAFSAAMGSRGWIMILASHSTSRSSTCRQPIIKCMYSATDTYHICKKVECDHKKYDKKYCTPTIHFV